MNTSIRILLRELLPPFAWRLIQQIRSVPSAVEWKGPYQSWEEAAGRCSAYDSAEIIQKVIDSTRKVVAGEAVYERDSCLFSETEYSWSVLASILWIYAKEGHLNCIDFGGSLGSTFRQNRKFLAALSNIEWNIVEQPHFVDAGKREFETARLKFKMSMSEVYAPNAILFLSSLCYLENPWKFLEEATEQGSPYLIIDRTPFREGAGDEVYVQTVRPPIYEATYPCRVFSQQDFEKNMARLGRVCHEKWQSELQPNADWRYLGYFLIRNG